MIGIITRTNKLIGSVILFALCVGCKEPLAYGQPKHDETATKLIERLKDNQLEGRILLGHHDDLLYGYNWKYDQNKRLFEQSDIKEVAGDYPAILGFDLGSIEYYGLKFERGNTFAAMIDAIKTHHARGGVVTVSAHMRNVVTGETAWDVSKAGVVRSILKDRKTKKRFYEVLDLYAKFLSCLIDSTGTKIPVLFRPWHEANLNCFWWGTNLCSDKEYRKLWKLTYSYLVKEKGLDNLVWVYSPSEVTSERVFNRRYPGNAYVDVIGFECYQRIIGNEDLEQSSRRFARQMGNGLSLLNKLTKKHHKIGAITETGFASVPLKDWWTQNLYPQLEKANISYLFIWGNRYQDKSKVYGPYKGSADAADFCVFSKSNKCILLDRAREFVNE